MPIDVPQVSVELTEAWDISVEEADKRRAGSRLLILHNNRSAKVPEPES